MAIMYTPPCDKCGKIFAIPPKTTEPIMVGFELSNGSIVNYCYSCLCEIGKESMEKGKHNGK